MREYHQSPHVNFVITFKDKKDLEKLEDTSGNRASDRKNTVVRPAQYEGDLEDQQF